MEIGVQFYTLRDRATCLCDLAESLKRVADIGYKTVQLSCVCPYEPEWIKEQLDKNGLRCVLTHYDANKIKENTEEVVKFHRSFGCEYIGVGSMPWAVNEENLRRFISEYKEPCEKLAELGTKLFYHHHHWEFSRVENGNTILDELLLAFKPEELGITLDTYWAQFGGADPAALVERLKGRVECMHLKDLAIVGNEQRMAPVGRGNINFDRIISKAETAGAKYLLVEQDNCYGEDPFKCIKESYDYLKAMGLK